MAAVWKTLVLSIFISSSTLILALSIGPFAESRCKTGQFACTDGLECVWELMFCDGKKDCRDGSDEVHLSFFPHKRGKIAGIPCRKDGDYLCLLLKGAVENHKKFCDKGTTCSKNGRYLCADGLKCINNRKFCDGKRDCKGGDDEIYIGFNISRSAKKKGVVCGIKGMNQCLLPKHQAHKKWKLCSKKTTCSGFLCDNGMRCISGKKFCNGEQDCRDGKDEIYLKFNATSSETKGISYCLSQSKQRLCLVPQEGIGKKQELKCNQKTDTVCGRHRYMCSDGLRCIENKEFCDGKPQCSDGSDEIYLSYNESLRGKIEGVACRSGSRERICLLPNQQIYKREELCTGGLTCTDGFLCKDSMKCTGFCGNESSCSDGSDTAYLNFHENKRGDVNGIPCRGIKSPRLCILPLDQADKKDILCAKPAGGHCGFKEYMCADGWKCIVKQELCDGTVHCSDGSDEIYQSYYYEPDISEGVVCSKVDAPKRCLLPAHQMHKVTNLCARGQRPYIYWYDYGTPGTFPDETCTFGFLCDNGTLCVHFGFCDGIKDCSDNTDEMYVSFKSTVPESDGIACYKADYHSQCLLPKDQMHKKSLLDCEEPGDLCEKGFACDDDWMECIPADDFCNSWPDCSNGKDEKRVDLNHPPSDGIPCRTDSYGSIVYIYSYTRPVFYMPDNLHGYFCLLPQNQMEKKDVICTKGSNCDDGFLCTSGVQCADALCGNQCGDGSDMVCQNFTLHQDGIPCVYQDECTCMLPTKQRHKEKLLCKPQKPADQECRNGFMCNDGEGCIYYRNFCDGKLDCKDGSDEIRIKTTSEIREKDGIHCFQDSSFPDFLIPGRACLLPANQLEKKKKLCESDCDFHCANEMQCIGIADVCDGRKDCSDGSDELAFYKNVSLPMTCSGFLNDPCCMWFMKSLKDPNLTFDAEVVCRKGFLCANKKKCIDSDEFCDGSRDCSDGSDEITITSENLLKTDGIPCYGHKDSNQMCLLPLKQRHKKKSICIYRLVKRDPGCEEGFLCDNGNCIGLPKFCDGSDDCRDGSDELRVSYNSTASPDRNFCRRRNSKSLCLLPREQSHKYRSLCYKDPSCNNNFLCVNQMECLPRRDFCDRGDNFYSAFDNDCSDGSDEIYVPFNVSTDYSYGIPCRNKINYHLCLLPRSEADKQETICTGDESCRDGFLCSDGELCVAINSFCNGKLDCSDGSDEIIYRGQLLEDGILCNRTGWSDELDYQCVPLPNQASKMGSRCYEY